MPKRTEDQFGSIDPPLYRSVAFAANSIADAAKAFSAYASRYAYGRMGNPSIKPFETWFAEFEGVGEGSVWATNTGMSAVLLAIKGSTSVQVGRGKRVVASPYVYGGTHHLLELLDRNGDIDLFWVEDPFSLASWEEAIGRQSHPACVLLETPSNPTIDVFDIRAIARMTHDRNSRLIVDNTLGVGLQWPIFLEADAVVYSVTKALNRASSELGGALVVSSSFRQEIEEVFDDIFVHYGLIMHPMSAAAVYEKRTTLVRDMELFSANALEVAAFLAQHPKVKRVNYPKLFSNRHFPIAQAQMPKGAGGILSFELESFEKAVQFIELEQEAFLAVHLGDGNNHLVTHPASTTHSKLSVDELRRLKITPELIRLSVSLGSVYPLIDDFERVLSTL